MVGEDSPTNAWLVTNSYEGRDSGLHTTHTHNNKPSHLQGKIWNQIQTIIGMWRQHEFHNHGTGKDCFKQDMRKWLINSMLKINNFCLVNYTVKGISQKVTE